MQKTSRGFTLIPFQDMYGVKCSIQKSSLANDDAIWLGVNDPNPQILASQAHQHGVQTNQTTGWVRYPIHQDVHMSTRMHLNRQQVKALLPLLNRFVDSGELE